MEEDFVGKDDDLDFDSGDVVMEMDGTLPSISFSHEVLARLIKPW